MALLLSLGNVSGIVAGKGKNKTASGNGKTIR
jgi:hypothetical protein